MELSALVIDADANQRSIICHALQNHNWNVHEAASLEAALHLIAHHPHWGIIFCDADLSMQSIDAGGRLTLLGRLLVGGVEQKIVLIATIHSPVTPLNALLNGVSEFIYKPAQVERIVEYARSVLTRLEAIERDERRDANGSNELTTDSETVAPEFIGASDAIIKVYKDLTRILCDVRSDGKPSARTFTAPPESIFITGETGTGKELIARFIHLHSKGAGAPFIPVNCGNLSPELAESKLFGHTPGAFTGASKERVGSWELAHGGTLFLDEITEAPPSVLPKLLRVLQDGRVERIGSNKWTQTDVQVIAASNRDMKEEVKAGRFRADLYHRLSLHRLHIPPLRERLEDVPLIVRHLTRRHFAHHVRFAQEALDALMSYEFPGNVRELENIVRGAARKSSGGVVYAVDLAAYLELMEANGEMHRAKLDELATIAKEGIANPSNSFYEESLEEQLQRHKIQIVRKTLARHNNNVAQAARALKICRQNFYNILNMGERDRRCANQIKAIASDNTDDRAAGAN